jgi:hypothetical protein
MGRLPSQWAGRDITMRIPYTMAGELIVASNQSGVQYPDSVFTNNVDMPFECHRMIPRVTGLDSSKNVQANQLPVETMLELVRLRVNDFGKNVIMTKNPTLANTLVKGSSERTWEWADPYYLVRSEGFQVVVDSLLIPDWSGNQFQCNCDGTPTDPNPLASLRVEVSFQGFLIQVAPPSNTR